MKQKIILKYYVNVQGQLLHVGQKKEILSSHKLLSMTLLVILSKYIWQKSITSIKKLFNSLNARYIVCQEMIFNSF